MFFYFNFMKEMLRFLHSGDKVKLTDRTVYTFILLFVRKVRGKILFSFESFGPRSYKILAIFIYRNLDT
jgi:hypothetical protein